MVECLLLRRRRKRDSHTPQKQTKRSFWARRWRDALAVLGLWISWILAYTHWSELLAPPYSVVARLLDVISHVIFLLAVLSWFGVMFHGPGRVQKQQPREELAEPLQLAMEIGCFNKAYPFEPTEGWCRNCECWKPSLANHCRYCAKCSVWMDHHCNFVATCIGFKNLRCFLVMLLYGGILLLLVFMTVVRRILLDPMSLLGTFAGAKVIVWLGGCHFFFSNCYMHLTSCTRKIGSGWFSSVLFEKFDGSMEHALQMHKVILQQDLDEKMEMRLMHAVSCACGAKGSWSDGEPQGILGMPEHSLSRNLPLVFGRDPSWRWLLPLVSGGRGDPLRPSEYDAKVCRAWNDLAVVLRGVEKEVNVKHNGALGNAGRV